VAGVMLREQLNGSSKEVFLGLNTRGQLVFDRRKIAAERSWELALPGEAPMWLRLVRQGNVFSGWSSSNGSDWRFVWVARVNMSTGITAGLAVTGGETSGAAAVQFDHVEAGAVSSVPTALSPGEQMGLVLGGVAPGAGGSGENGAQLLVYGTPGDVVVLEASSDLKTWEELRRFTMTTVPGDLEEELVPMRFFRARRD
ncbi:MAG TPA: hypothetical protein VMZ27_05455, partial [Candidatus Saccharimonadales bacterium]|nr:hypothetical protein [Candidatus Saccharimonadales bacterium]